ASGGLRWVLALLVRERSGRARDSRQAGQRLNAQSRADDRTARRAARLARTAAPPPRVVGRVTPAVLCRAKYRAWGSADFVLSKSHPPGWQSEWPDRPAKGAHSQSL